MVASRIAIAENAQQEAMKEARARMALELQIVTRQENPPPRPVPDEALPCLF